MSKNSATAEAFGYTQVKVAKFKYTWTINNYRFYCYGNESLLSPIFSIDSNVGLTWYLEIYEYFTSTNDGNSESSSDHNEEHDTICYAALSLNCLSNNSEKPTRIECKFSILNGEDSVVQEKVMNKKTLPPARSPSDYNYHSEFYPNFFILPTFIAKTELLNNLNALTFNQSIRVICEICAWIENENYPNQIVIPESVLPDPLELLFENPKYSDVTLSADGTDFKVHKAILATQCQVFEAMFIENLSNRVEIIDLNEATLRELLRFIYTGKVLNLQEMTKDLLRAADKYALRTLKVMCENELYRQLSITNALSIFILADMYSSNQLKNYVKNFIRVHVLYVINTSEWKIMNQEHPILAKEILVTP